MSMNKLYFSQLKNNKIIKSVLIVASGTIGAQAIGMALIPFITRLYGPEVYGHLGVFLALINIFTPLATLSYPVAIVLPESDIEAKSLIDISIAISITFCIFFTSIIFLYGDWVLPLIGASNLGNLIWFVPIGILLTAFQDVAQQWLIRKKFFKGIAKVTLTHSIVTYGTQAIAGLYYPLAIVLLGIYTAGIGLRTSILAFIGRNIPKSKLYEEKKYYYKTTILKYKDFPVYRAPQIILSAVSQSLPILMLTTYFGASTAGFYALTRTVLAMPITLLGTSVQSVFYPHFNEAFLSKRNVKKLLKNAVLSLAGIGSLPFLLLIVFGPWLFSLVFGNIWQTAGTYAQWLSVWLFFSLINRPCISAIPIFGLQRWFLIYEIISLVIRYISLFLGFTIFHDALTAIAIFSVNSAILAMYLTWKIFSVANFFDSREIV